VLSGACFSAIWCLFYCYLVLVLVLYGDFVVLSGGFAVLSGGFAVLSGAF
jgi:hypothetical protein